MSSFTPTNVLVTGGAGFIGSHFVELLLARYHNIQVVVLDCLNYSTSSKHLDEFEDNPNFKFIQGDICSADLVRHIMEEYMIDTIVHFAAESHVDHSFGNSFKFTQNNVLGTHVLLEAAREREIERFLHISTDEVYGETRDGAANEESLLMPTNPYAASKAAAEMLVRSYHKSFNLPIIITRSNNIYGPRQYPEKLIPKYICSLLQERPLYIHGEGFQTRNFLYVKDLVEAVLLVLTKGKIGEVYNIDSPDEFSVTDIAKKVIEMMGIKKQVPFEFVRDRDFNDSRYHITGDKIRDLGWKPETEFNVGLTETIRWYRRNAGNWGDLGHVLVPHSNKCLD